MRRLGTAAALALAPFLSAHAAVSIWPETAAPARMDAGADQPVELGVRFRADSSGTITGIRFYKAAANVGAHAVHLWTADGTLLAASPSTSETQAGWQEVTFAAPVPIAANVVYVASYHTDVGHYSADASYFSAGGVDRAPLHALPSGFLGPDGCYAYGPAGTFPENGFNSTNYWVDVAFEPTALPPPVLLSISLAPASAVAAVGATVPFVAMGAYLDASTADITTQVSWTSSNTNVATITASGVASTLTAGTITITATLGSVTAITDLTVQPAPLFTMSIWPASATPSRADGGADNPVELGVRFRADVGGTVAGLRFYKAAANTGPHVGHLWTSNGTLLAAATFSNETASGWQQVSFAVPVPIVAGAVYVASYHTAVGHYSVDGGYFAGMGLDRAPLHALVDGLSGPDGCYGYGPPGTFPRNGFNASNYWVDVVFTSASIQPPTVSSITIAPVNPVVAPGSAVMFTATATYSDGSTGDVTTQAAWSSSSTAVATVDGTGHASALAAGTTTIAAALGSAASSTTLTVQPTTSDAVSIWPSTAAPAVADAGNDGPVEIGVRLRAEVSGSILGVRFYKSPTNVGAHVAHLWTSDGVLLATATFAGETSSGWQQANFAAPVPIAAETVYVASYHTNVGHYARDARYFAKQGIDRPPLHAPGDGASGPNGCYGYGPAGTFPQNGFNGTNYWVDVAFRPASPAEFDWVATPIGSFVDGESTVAHVGFDGTSWLDTHGGTGWAAVGAPPGGSSGAFFPARGVAGPFAASSLYEATRGDGVLNLTGDFSVCARFAPGVNPGMGLPSKIILAKGEPEWPRLRGGWALMQMHNAFCFHYQSGAGETMSFGLTGQSDSELASWDYAYICGGRSGNLIHVDLHGDPAGSGLQQPVDGPMVPSADPATIGAYLSGAEPLLDGGIFEAIVTTDPGSDATYQRLVAQAERRVSRNGVVGAVLRDVPADYIGSDGLSHRAPPFSARVIANHGLVAADRIRFQKPVKEDTSVAGLCLGIVAEPSAGVSWGSQTSTLLDFDDGAGSTSSLRLDGQGNLCIASGTTTVAFQSACSPIPSWAAGSQHLVKACLGPLERKFRIYLDGDVAPLILAGNDVAVPDLSNGALTVGGALDGYVARAFACANPDPTQCGPPNGAAPPAIVAPTGLWSDSSNPGPDLQDASAITVGVQFRTSVPGQVTAIRFYKHPANTGMHTVGLWTGTGDLLSSVTVSGETLSGWQTASLPMPVAISSNAWYVAGYNAPQGHYAASPGYFTTSRSVPPLYAPATTQAANGLFRYGPALSFPDGTYGAANYWVDVLFTASGGP